MYLTATRPDLTFSVCMLSRFMESPKRSHWEAGKRVLLYLCGTVTEGIFYRKVEDSGSVGYCDSDWGGSFDDCKSTSGYVFSIGSGVISWTSKKQSVVALSTAESEYISLALASCQALWIRWILEELKHHQVKGTTLFCDNSSAISLTKNPVFHGKSKHIRIKFHFIRDLVKDGEIVVEYCKTQDQLADIFTKALKCDTFNKMKKKLGMTVV
ncbi:hypothetical protein Vadar_003382 [Vaccinium darrowii]|uniref:Uncharacterized protein n=1 Tax=Vaccinium darrowii TaxID=229202 RepID=A0ACB7Y506_9ERIC|nr:hypothetical protein Vadar_003382 [Vaccinium darrowii]